MKFASFRLPVDTLILGPTQAREHQTHNLVVIGGKDVNSVTEELTSRMGCQLEPLTNEKGRNVVRDHRLNVDHPVTWQNEPDANGEIHRVDYGILTRGCHPDDRSREVLLLAGAHGLGTPSPGTRPRPPAPGGTGRAAARGRCPRWEARAPPSVSTLTGEHCHRRRSGRQTVAAELMALPVSCWAVPVRRLVASGPNPGLRAAS